MQQLKLYTLQEIAIILGKTPSLLRKYRQQGYNFMQAKRKSGKIQLYTVEELEIIKEKLLPLIKENAMAKKRGYYKR